MIRKEGLRSNCLISSRKGGALRLLTGLLIRFALVLCTTRALIRWVLAVARCLLRLRSKCLFDLFNKRSGLLGERALWIETQVLFKLMHRVFCPPYSQQEVAL